MTRFPETGPGFDPWPAPMVGEAPQVCPNN